MNKKIYRQADSRWGSLPYPTKAYSFAHNGCGCCSVTHCVIELDKYKNYTPADVRKYMVQFATKGHGTLWNGITKGLEHYGYKVHWKQSDSMSDIYKVLANSLKRGVILFGSTRGPDGTVWTTGGHYIAFVDYRIKDGKHQFYLKDSGGRKHDKWWTYEKSMRGDVRNVWICTGLKDETKDDKKEEKKEETKKDTAKPKKAIDISEWQGKISASKFKQVKADGYDVVIMRASYTSQSSFNLHTDSVFVNNVKNAHAAGLKIGVYHYSQAITIAEAQKEADYILKVIKPYKSYITEQVVFDWEFGKRLNASKAKSNGKLLNTRICEGFCNKVKAAGYDPMVYANLSTLQGYLNDATLKKEYKIWLAQYSSSTSYKGYYLWQYSSNGSVKGLPGRIDVNKFGSGTASSTASKTPTNTAAKDDTDARLVVDGKAGAKTIKKAQKWLKTPIDGKISGQLEKYRQYHKAFADGVIEYGSGKGSAFVKALQKKLGLKNPDGILGPVTIKALQKFLGVYPDGICGKDTIRALQIYLNNEMDKKKLANQKAIQAAIDWATMICNDNEYCYGNDMTKSNKRAHHFGCHFCGTNTGPVKNIKGKELVKGLDGKMHSFEKTYCCNPFVSACFAHGALDPKLLAACRRATGVGLTVKSYTKWGCFKQVDIKDIKPGDVVIWFNKHAALYVAEDKLAHAHNGSNQKKAWTKDSISITTLSKEKRPAISAVLRYTGKGAYTDN